VKKTCTSCYESAGSQKRDSYECTYSEQGVYHCPDVYIHFAARWTAALDGHHAAIVNSGAIHAAADDLRAVVDSPALADNSQSAP
jgi:hypothetical protein